MTTDLRLVRHLKLRAPDAAQARRAALLLEDALRCASLPATGERLLVVRRLALGRLPSPSLLSSQSLALAIERRVAAGTLRWARGDDDGAARDAQAVGFDSRLDAVVTALGWHAEGRRLDGWHWPLALPGCRLGGDAGELIDDAAVLLEGEPGGSAAQAPALVCALVRKGHAGWLLRQAPAATVARWLAAVPARPAASRTAMSGGATADDQDSGGWLHRLLHAAGAGPDEHAAVRRAAKRGNAPAAVAQTVPASGPDAGPSGGPSRQPMRSPSAALPGSATPQPTQSAIRAIRAAAPAPGRPPHRGPVTAPSRATSSASTGTAAPWPWPDGEPTACGGLLFVVVALWRLGFGDWQQVHADTPLAGRILARALIRLRAPRNDPAWRLAASLPRPLDADGRPLARRGRAAAVCDAQACCWLDTVRRWLRRDAGIGLASLVLRPARLGWGPTHLDAHLPLAGCDLRVRRTGLDLDPGWIAGLGRVVRFHYGRENNA